MQLGEAKDQNEIQNSGTNRHDISEVTIVIPETLSEQGEETEETSRIS